MMRTGVLNQMISLMNLKCLMKYIYRICLHYQPELKLDKREMIWFALNCLNALGVVYGDIGTSPLYTLKAIFGGLPPTESEVKGICKMCCQVFTVQAL